MVKLNQPGHGASKFRGVARKPGAMREWRAQIQLSLGNYESELDAADIYVRAEKMFREQAMELRRAYGDLREE